MAVNLIPLTLPTQATGELSPELRKLLAAQLMKQSTSGSSEAPKITHPVQGYAHIAEKLLQGMAMRKLMNEDKASQAELSKALTSLPGLNTPMGEAGVPQQPQVAPPSLSPSPPPPPPDVPPPVPGPEGAMGGNPFAGLAKALAGSAAPPPPMVGSYGEALGVTPSTPAPDAMQPNPQALAAMLAQKAPAEPMAPVGPPPVSQAVPSPAPTPPVNPALLEALKSGGPQPPMAAPQGPAAPPMSAPGMAVPPPQQPMQAPEQQLPLPPQYLDQIKKFEGFTPRAQWDHKQYSIGYGTRASGPNETIDRATADQRFNQEIGKAAAFVDSVLPPNAPPGAREALTSLTYNAGPKWAQSGLGQLVREGNWQEAAQRFLQYNKASGQTLPGLVNRRQAEAQWINGQPQQPQGPQALDLNIAQAGGPPPMPPQAPQRLASLNPTMMPPMGPPSPQPPVAPPQGPQMAQMGGMVPVQDAPMSGRPQMPMAAPQMPPQMAAPPPAPTPMAQPPMAQPAINIPPQIAGQIRQYLGSKNPKVQALGMQLYQQYAKPSQPEFGVIGKDASGNEMRGWIDPRSRTVSPVQVPGSEPPPNSVVPPAPPGVDPAIWRKQHSERHATDAMPADYKTAAGLRKEVQDTPSYKNIAQAAPIYKSMLNAAGRDTRAADVNLIYGMAKIMDPGSVVRESEMTVAQAISTLPQHLRATVESQLTGAGRLSPDVREAIMQEAHSRMNAYTEMYEQDAGFYRGIAKRNRALEDDVVPRFGPFEPFKRPEPASPTRPTQSTPVERWERGPDGTLRKVQ